MQEMATTAHHHHFVLGSVGLIDIYRAIVSEIGVASAYDVTITETVSPEFEIVEGSYDANIPRPTYNKDTNTLTWSMNELKDQALNLDYKIRLKDGVLPGTYNFASSSKITYKDYTGKACSYTISNNKITVKYLPLTVESITEPKANVAGGETVTIKGTNFRDGATVKFNSTLATDVVVVDENTITATVPAGAQGKATVTVTNDDKSSGTLDFYYEADPEITSVTPNEGPFEGGTSVKINGANFTSDAKVYFGDQEVSSSKFYNSGYILVTSPRATVEGAVDVKVENGDGTQGVLKDGFTYLPEVIEELEVHSIDVTSGDKDGGTRVILKGKNIDNGAKVYFGNKEATVVRYYNSESLLLDTPSQDAAGVVDVTVENLDGATATLSDAFTYTEKPAPEITSISPNSGFEAGGESVTITGENFQSTATVTFGGNEAKVTKRTSTTSIVVTVPAGIEGKVDVEVTNPDGKTATEVEGYEYISEASIVLPAPEITNVSLLSGNEAGGDLVYIDGKNFQENLIVTFGDNEAQLLNYYSANRIRVKVPAGTPGEVKIKVTNPDGQSAEYTELYEYIATEPDPAPIVTSVSALSGTEAGGEIVYIEGENFQKDLTVTFGDNEAQLLNYYSANRIRVKVPAGNPGKVSVKVTNPDGQSGECSDLYEYTEVVVPAPEISSISATEGSEDGGTILYIEGNNFKSGLVVRFGSEEAELLNYYNETKIRVRTPANSVGVVDVTVENPDGQSATLSDAFTYTEVQCEITVLSATSGELAGGEIVTIEGTNFESGLTVKFGNNTATLMNYYSSSKIRVKVPEGDNPGSVDVIVENPSGRIGVLSNGYTYNELPPVAAPSLEYISTKGTVASTVTEAAANTIVYIHGTDFQTTFTVNMYDASGNKVVDGLKPLNCYSAIRGRFRLPSTLAKGSYKITITNEDGQESNELDFEIV